MYAGAYGINRYKNFSIIKKRLVALWKKLEKFIKYVSKDKL